MSSYGILKNGVPAERQRGLIFCEKFENAGEVQRNGGVVTGTPEINNGAVLNGITDFVTSDLPFIVKDEITFMVKFTPDFAKDEGVARYIMDTEPTARYYMYRQSNGKLAFLINNSYNTVLYDDYKDYWVDFGVNVIAITAGFTKIYVYLNGILILDIPAVSLSPPSWATWGARNNGVTFFKGTIHSAVVFLKQLTPEEILDYYNESVFNYEKDAVLNLPMGVAQHDSANNQTLDVSGYNNHAQFGDGVTPSKFPVKIGGRRGYEFNGTPYFEIANPVFDPNSDFSVTLQLKLKGISGYMGFIAKRDTGSDGFYCFFNISGNILRSQYNSAYCQSSVVEASLGEVKTLTITCDVSGLMRMYVNGREVDSVDISAQTISLINEKVYLGTLPTGGTASSTNIVGEIISVQVHAKVLTPMQIADLHNKMIYSINVPVPNITPLPKPFVLISAPADGATLDRDTNITVSGRANTNLVNIYGTPDGGDKTLLAENVTVTEYVFSTTVQLSSSIFEAEQDVTITVEYADNPNVYAEITGTTPSGDYIIDDFESYAVGSDPIGQGWTVVVAPAQYSVVIDTDKYSGDKCWQMHAYPLNQANYQKIIDRANYYNKTLKIAVKVQDSNTSNQFGVYFYDGTTYRGYVSFSGTITTTAWQVLEFVIPWNVNIDRVRLRWLPKYNYHWVRVDDVKIAP